MEKTILAICILCMPAVFATYNGYFDFTNGLQGDWDQQTTSVRQNNIHGVWAMHSIGQGDENWTRMRFKEYTFNAHPAAYTRIKVVVRGAPDGGKNSNAYLIETRDDRSNSGAVQDGTKDEIDFFEYYGGNKLTRPNLFRRGQQVPNYPLTLNYRDGGNRLYGYEMVLNNAQRSFDLYVYDEAGRRIDHKHLEGDFVPSEPMELFIGIWDCSGNGYCPGKTNGDTWMAVKSVEIEAR